MWFVYILRCADNSLYTGITTDVARRMNEHNSTSRGAAYTRVRRPVTLVYKEATRSHHDAILRELAIKKLPKSRKEALISTST